MAQVKFISTTSDKLNSIEVNAGNLIFVKDERTIYLDTDTRTAYQDIICLATESQRTTLPSPLKGFYFVEETCVLWRYNEEWEKITNTPKDQIIFAPRESFPAEGKSDALYIDDKDIYRYLNGDYVLINNTIDWGVFQ